jgi:hypothetical protein
MPPHCQGHVRAMDVPRNQVPVIVRRIKTVNRKVNMA